MYKGISGQFLYQGRKLIANHCANCTLPCVTALCAECMALINKPTLRCIRCGHQMTAKTVRQTCKICIMSPPAYDYLNYIGIYNKVLQNLIIRAKLHRDVAAIAGLRYIIKLNMAHFMVSYPPANLLAMPTPLSRLMLRGYNLPSLMLTEFKAQTGLVLGKQTTLKLPFYVRKQAKMSLQQRKKNKHYYKVKAKSDLNMIIFDDIVTTGNTVNELAKKLKRNGARTVAVWAVARGQLQ